MIRKKCIVSLVTAVVVLLLNCLQVLAAHIENKDYAGHWADKQISELIDKGIVKGYEDGSFKPDAEISRAEFFTLVNKVFGLKELKNVKFEDVKEEDWYFGEVGKAIAAGYASGYEGYIKPNDNINRIEAAKILSVVQKQNLSTADSVLSVYKDLSVVPVWGTVYIGNALDKKLFYATSDGYIQPYKHLTRAEAVTAIYKASGGQTDDKGLIASVGEKDYKGVLYTSCCVKKAPDKESKKCLSMPGCAANGYGVKIINADSTYVYYKFDAAGQKLAKENILDKTVKEANITVTVKGIEGESEDGTLKVLSISEYNTEEVQKSSETKEVSLTGTLIDKHCFAFGDPESDTIECLRMESCAASGYGIAVKQADGSYLFYKLDEQGQKSAAEILKNTDKESNIVITVKGLWNGEILKVTSILL